MPELCGYFQRGSCKYGARCKYVHANPQRQQQQQQHNQKPTFSPNPFGFGAQSSANNNNNYKQPQQKAFENKWNRFTPLSSNSAAAPSSKQSDTQSQSSNHKCTDPDACKSVITEDFQRERPLWKLTCYGHLRNGPCDIFGDISYEELRFAAYEDSKRGLSLQSIVDRERNLLNSKLAEFENLLRNPYKAPSNSNLATHGPFPVATPNAFSANGQSGAPPTVSSFGQLGASLSMRPSAPSNNSFGQSNPFTNSSHSSSTFGIRPPAPSNNPFAQVNPFPNTSLTSSAFAPSQLPYANSVSNMTGFGNNGVTTGMNSFSSSALSNQNLNASGVQIPKIPTERYTASSAAEQTTRTSELVNNVQQKNGSGDASIWLKDKWTPGEIPEEAPPDEFIR